MTTVSSGPTGTFAYMAPGMFSQTHTGASVDFYLFGCLLIKLFGQKTTMARAFRSSGYEDGLWHFIMQHLLVPAPLTWNDLFKFFVLFALRWNPRRGHQWLMLWEYLRNWARQHHFSQNLNFLLPYNMWQSQVEKEHYSYHFLTTFYDFARL